LRRKVVLQRNPQAQKPASPQAEQAEASGLSVLLCEAKAMIDDAYDIIEIWDVSGSPYNKKWKKDWLDKAKNKFGAIPSL